MAWFKPARNRKHPGDPPPRWAPIGRVGRLVLVATVIAGIAIVLVLRLAGASDDREVSIANGDASASSSAGQRIEVPDAGFALTLPADWTYQVDEEGAELTILTFVRPERFGPEVELRNLIAAWGPGVYEHDRLHVCTLIRYAPIDVSPARFLQAMTEQHDGTVVESLHEGLSRVLMNQWLDSRILADQPEATYTDHYAIRSDDAIGNLMCYGRIAHRDDWLAIAESYEALP